MLISLFCQIFWDGNLNKNDNFFVIIIVATLRNYTCEGTYWALAFACLYFNCNNIYMYVNVYMYHRGYVTLFTVLCLRPRMIKTMDEGKKLYLNVIPR